MNKVYLGEVESYLDCSLNDFITDFFSDINDIFFGKKRILIKPNILQACSPEKGVTTHPEFIRVVIKSLKKIGNFEILLGDSPGANFINYDKVLDVTGINKVCLEENIRIVKIENFKPIEKDGILISSIIDEVDLIVNLPKLKTHSLTGLTLAVKNLFGLIPGTKKVGYHRDNPIDKDLADSIFKIYKLVKEKSIHLLDGIIAHEGDGPSRGNPKKLNIVAASTNAVCLDMAICDVLGLNRNFCLTNYSAEKMNMAEDFSISKTLTKKSIKLPVSKKIFNPPRFLKKVVANNVYVKPEVNKNCIGCLLCLKSCPVCAIKTSSNGKVVINKQKCIECFCCHEVCESNAIDLKRSFLHKVIVND